MVHCDLLGSSCDLTNFEAQVPCCWAYGSTVINHAVCPYIPENTTSCQGGDYSKLMDCLKNTTMGFSCGTSRSAASGSIAKNFSLLKIATMLLLACTAGLAHAQEHDGTSDILDLLGSSPSVDQVAYLDDVAIVVTAVEVANTSDVDFYHFKRDRPCVYSTVHYKQIQVVRTGLWNGNWQPASSCLYTGLNPRDASQGISWGESHSVSYSAGFDLSISDLVLGAIKGNGGLNFGLEWTTTTSNTNTKSCPIPAYSVGQIWLQKKFGWSDSQVQDCSFKTGACGRLAVSCGPYSGYQHADWPIKGNDVDNTGCSSGFNNCNC
jgi:hypothetical protein